MRRTGLISVIMVVSLAFAFSVQAGSASLHRTWVEAEFTVAGETQDPIAVIIVSKEELTEDNLSRYKDTIRCAICKQLALETGTVHELKEIELVSYALAPQEDYPDPMENIAMLNIFGTFTNVPGQDEEVRVDIMPLELTVEDSSDEAVAQAAEKILEKGEEKFTYIAKALLAKITGTQDNAGAVLELGWEIVE